MANLSTRTPWVVQMWASNKWYDVGSYRFEDDARINRTLAEKQALEAKWRVIKKEEK